MGLSRGVLSELPSGAQPRTVVRAGRLQGIDPYVYFLDMLQRVDTHSAFDVPLPYFPTMETALRS
jgi:hypothetical protein